MPKIIKQIISSLFVFLIFFTTLTCKRSPIEPNGFEMLWLNFEDASCTEAWFNLKLNNLPKPVRVDVYRENYHAKSFTITATNDTLFYIENLLPKQKYEVYVKVKGSDGKEYTSTKINFETMDTTSHNFTWQIWEFGQHSSSTLYDVAIIDENNIWAVGEIYMLDSLGRPDPNAYNAVHWNGTKWELKRIPIYLPSGYPFYPVIKSVFAFNSNDIWFEAGIHWDGNSFKQIPFNIQWSGNVNKLWGSSSNDLYAVGNKGNIAHWDGRKWTKIESGTTLFLSDIWGVSSHELYATGNSRAFVRGVVLKGNGQTWQTMIVSESDDTTGLFRTRLYGAMEGLWVDERGTLYTVGNFMFQHKHGRWDFMHSLPGNYFGGNPNYLHRGYLHDVHGNSSNDMFICGQINTLRHFNGVSWAEVGIPYYPLKYGLFWYRVAVKGNTAVAVGSNLSRGVVIRLWR
ncbi:MAG: glucosyl transferase [Ignavibacteria bacterium]|jgi:hypothetical protein|nr:glucosyl transferase [Ignavibacteria bacterium]MDH7528874.1 glucosyl transferase [Ignavibacteria bacterium]